MSIAKPVEMVLHRTSLSTLFLAATIVLAVGLIGWTLYPKVAGGGPGLEDITDLDGERAFGYLNDICEFGPRPSNSEGMHRQQRWLTEKLGDSGVARWIPTCIITSSCIGSPTAQDQPDRSHVVASRFRSNSTAMNGSPYFTSLRQTAGP